MLKKIFCSKNVAVLIFLTILNSYYLILNPFTSAQEPDFPISCKGDDIEYIDGNKKLVGKGNIRIEYEDMKLTADEVELDLEKKLAEARGNVRLQQTGNCLSAQKIEYDFNKNTGTLFNARVAARPWYGECEKAVKVSDKEVVMYGGYLSTCERLPAHYKISARQINLFLNDRVEAKNVTVSTGRMPVMFMPAYVHSIKQAKPKFSITPGHDKDWGYYTLGYTRYNIADGQRGKLHLDQRSKKGYAGGVTHMYDFISDGKKTGGGIAELYYMQERDRHKPEGEPAERERYKAQLRQRLALDENTLLLAEYNKFSDISFTQDYFYRQEYEIDPQPRTYVSLVNMQADYTSSVLYRKRSNRFFSETEYLPQAGFDIKSRRFSGAPPLYYKGNIEAAALTKKNAGSKIDDDALRLDSYNELSLPFTPGLRIMLNPYTGMRQTFYSKDEYGDENRTRGIFYGGIDATTSFGRIFDVTSRFAGLDVNGLRHIIRPLVRYAYIHSPTIGADELADFDDIDGITRKNTVTLSLENNFQTKRRRPEQADKDGGAPSSDGEFYDVADFARFILSADYLFRPEDGSRFSDITADLEINPAGRLLIESDGVFDPHTGKFNTANLDFVVKEHDRKRLGIGHRFQRNESSQLTADLLYPLTGKLGLHVYQRYEFHEMEPEEQEYGLTADLHCWEVDLNINSGNGSTVWLVLRLKAFPDAGIKLGTSYRGPKQPSPVE